MISADASASTANSCGIAVMAKASAPGRTKTRLVPPLTGREAAAFNTAFLQDISTNILEAARDLPIQPYMAYGPPGPESVAFFRDVLPPDVRLLEAWWPDFGSCLYGAIDQLLELGHTSAVVLNSDSPTLPTSLLVATAEMLTAAIISSASSRVIAGCFRISRGAPIRLRGRRSPALPRSGSPSICCLHGTMSTTRNR